MATMLEVIADQFIEYGTDDKSPGHRIVGTRDGTRDDWMSCIDDEMVAVTEHMTADGATSFDDLDFIDGIESIFEDLRGMAFQTREKPSAN